MTAGRGSLLLLAPSRGLGGGIERVAASIEEAWPAALSRVDLDSAAAAPSATAKARFALRAVAQAARTRPETVLCLHIGLLPVAAAAAAAGRSRLGLIGMGREVWVPAGRGRQRLARRCDAVLAISPFSAEWMARRLGVEVAVVLAPVAARFAQRAAESAGRAGADGTIRVLTVSRVTRECRYKGHGTVAEAVALLGCAGRTVRWTVVGDGDDLPALRAHAERLALGASADFRGRVSDAELERLYAEADVMALPSAADPTAEPPVGEGFGLVYAEAGAFGVPSIAAADGGGSSAFVVDGETGLTVPAQAPEALAAAIARLQDDPALRARLGAQARERVLAHHLPARFAESLASALTR